MMMIMTMMNDDDDDDDNNNNNNNNNNNDDDDDGEEDYNDYDNDARTATLKVGGGLTSYSKWGVGVKTLFLGNSL